MLARYLPRVISNSLYNLGCSTTNSPTCRRQVLRALHTFYCLHSNKSGKESEGIKTFILLHDEGDKILGIKTKKEADELAKKKKMMLELVTPLSAKGKAVYKLTRPGDLQNELKQKENSDLGSKQTKTEAQIEVKRLVVSSKSQSHDIQVKLRSMKKWLEDNHEINLVITIENNIKAAENILDQIGVALKPLGAKIFNKVTNQTRIKVIIKVAPNYKGDQDVKVFENVTTDEIEDLDKLGGIDILSDEFVEKLNESIKKDAIKKR